MEDLKNVPGFQEAEKTAAEGSAVGHKSALAPPRFRSQWDEDIPSFAEYNDLPTCTIPDQSMTISEIIARFTRSGIMPVKDYSDQGGNSAPDDPEFDPMDFDPDYWKNEAQRLKAALDAQGENEEENTENVDKNLPSTE